MMDLKNMNNNIISNRWKARYEKLPDDVKKKLDDLNNADIFDYQLQVIKRKRNYPSIGDIFEINPKDSLFFYGIVVNNHINNINGKDLLCQTAHYGRRKPHVDFGTSASPTAQSRG